MANQQSRSHGASLPGRKIKKIVFEVLLDQNWRELLPGLLAYPPPQLVGPLFSALFNADPVIKWHGVSAFGMVASAMAEEKMEDARIVLRRCMWMLTDESGGIGWGVPEAMGEILACHQGLAKEFHTILLSYIHESPGKPDNYLEYAPLRRGAVWGVGRLASARPDMAAKAEDDLILSLKDDDAITRGNACWALSFLPKKHWPEHASLLVEDQTRMTVYMDGRLVPTTISELARSALSSS